jgi:hypothetical protein
VVVMSISKPAKYNMSMIGTPKSHYSGTFNLDHFPWKTPRNNPRTGKLPGIVPGSEKTSCPWHADVTH